jgi:hypothetical protein
MESSKEMKVISLVLLGAILHMLYLDGIFIYEMKRADKCFVENDFINDEKAQECLERLNNAGRLYKGKYFGINSALNYKRIVTKWKME